MKTCPVCGFNNPDDSVFCQRCGSMINQTFNSDIQQGITNQPGGQQLDNRTKEALVAFRNSLFWIFIGLILTIFISIVGEIILFIAAIKLIIALEKIGKTSLPSASKLNIARKWLIVNFISETISAIFAIIVVIGIFEVFISSVTTGGNITMNESVRVLTTRTLLPGISYLILAIIILGAINAVTGFAFYFTFGRAVEALGDDLREFNIIKGGRRIITAAVVMIFAIISVIVFLGGFFIIAGKTTLNAYTLSTVTSLIIVPSILGLASYIIAIFAIHSIYRGLDKYYL